MFSSALLSTPSPRSSVPLSIRYSFVVFAQRRVSSALLVMLRKSTIKKSFEIGGIHPAAHSMDNDIFDLFHQASHTAAEGVCVKGSKPRPFKFATESRMMKRAPPRSNKPSDKTLRLAQKLRKSNQKFFVPSSPQPVKELAAS